MLTATLVAVLIYLVIMIGAGIYAKRWVTDSADYMLAGREFGGVANVMELCAVALAGSLLTFVPTLVLNYGLKTAIVGYICMLGLGYCCYGIIYGKLARDNGAQTVAEYLELRYNANVRTLVAVASSITMIGVTANNVLAIGSLFSSLLGIKPILVTSVCFIVIIIFALMSGFWGITLTDMIQVVIGGCAFIGLFLYLASKYGGMDFLVANFPSGDLWNVGVNGATTPVFSLKYPSFFTLFLNYMIFLLWGSNYYYLRVNTCRNGKVGRNSYMFTGLIMVPLLLTPLAFVGAYAAAAHPDVFGAGGTLGGSSAVAYMLQEVPVPLVVLVLLGALAVTVSTASTTLIGVTSTLCRDIYQRRMNPNVSQDQLLKVQKVLMLVVALVGWALCFYPGGTVFLFSFATSWLGPVAILMIMSSLWPRFTNQGAFWGALVGMILLTLSTLLDVLGIFNVAAYAHSSVVGLFSALIVGVIVSLCTKPNYYGASDWKRIPEEGKRENISLNDFDKQILAMTRFGMITMAEITDYLGCDSQVSKESVEKLDRNGYIIREGMQGSSFYHYTISEKGEAVLDKLSPEDEKLRTSGLSREQFEVLSNAGISNDQMQQYAKEHGFGSLKMTSIISLLDHRGYVKQKGLMKRKVVLTDEGRKVVALHSEI
jgi:SSS family solute:Na+ symporter